MIFDTFWEHVGMYVVSCLKVLETLKNENPPCEKTIFEFLMARMFITF